jgi:hypothetical protein
MGIARSRTEATEFTVSLIIGQSLVQTTFLYQLPEGHVLWDKSFTQVGNFINIDYLLKLSLIYAHVYKK